MQIGDLPGQQTVLDELLGSMFSQLADKALTPPGAPSD
jgi:hypothetical protein